jgi:hypothetical protein
VQPLPTLDTKQLKTVLQSFEDFATSRFPLRPSQSKKLRQCGVMVIMESIAATSDEGGAAAQIGSVTHEAIAAFHREQNNALKTEAGFVALAAALPKFPLADRRQAEIYFEHYQADPRNRWAEFARSSDGQLAIEMPVRLELPPHKLDHTGEKVVIEGRLDQIRVIDKQLCVCDYKTGQSTIFQMMHDYAYQLACYWHAAVSMGYDVREAKIIRGYTYRMRDKTAELPSPSGVFITMPFSYKGATLLLDGLRREVAMIRRGEVEFGPGSHCSWCAYNGLDNCIPAAGERFGLEYK